MIRKYAFVLIYLLFSVHLLHAEPSTYTVCVWNTENFGVTDRFIDNKYVKSAMKPEREISSMMAILKKINPDILGLSEIIQDPQDKNVQLFKKRLADVDLKYPYSATILGQDPRIQILLLSRFPIAENNSSNQETFPVTIKSKSTGETKQTQMKVSRGIINCLIQVNSHEQVRVMQVHLKSRRTSSEFDNPDTNEAGDAYIRRNEALILKNMMNRTLEKNPETKLLVMGDFNDVPKSQPIQTIIGPKSATIRTFDLWLKDYFGDWWTYFYFPEKQYERIDYMVVSQGLFKNWVSEKSYIYRQHAEDSAEYNTYVPSDHRPLVAVFKTD
jgi:endonuclease/exonuclease/phosphatase family metal-dependent hydrolase